MNKMEKINFNKLKEINEQKIAQLNEQASENNEGVGRKIEIHNTIKRLLDIDEGLFFNINYEEGTKILSYIVEENNVEDTYKELTSAEQFARLKKEFKI